MSFGENLQFLRKRAGMTQEELAERLEVTRQSVSKWEGNSAYPEMTALLRLCELFGVDLDTLVRGDAQAALAEDSAGYDAHMNAFSRAVAGAVGLILLGVAVMVLMAVPSVDGIADSKLSDAVAILGVCVLLGCIAVAVAVLIAFGMGHDRFKKAHPVVRPFYAREEIDRFERRFPLLIALPVALIFIGIVLMFALLSVHYLFRMGSPEEWGGLGAGIMLLCIAAAVTALVWACLQKSKYDVEGYNRACRRELSPTPEEKRLDGITGVVWGCGMVLATAIYVGLGLAAGLWDWAAMIYPVAALVLVAVTIFLRRREED